MPQLQPFSQPMAVARPSREVMIAMVFSIFIHLFPAIILYIVATHRIAVEPAASSISTPLIVSLTTLPATSHNKLDIKEVSPIPATDLPIQHSQSFTERASIVEHKSEADTAVTSKDLAAPASKVSEGNPSATDATPSFDMEALYSMEWDFGKMPEFKMDALVASTGQGVPGSESSGDDSLANYLTPSFGLGAVNSFERMFGKMSESEVLSQRYEWRIRYTERYRASLPPDCRTYYADKGLFAIPFLIKDAITDSDNACKW